MYDIDDLNVILDGPKDWISNAGDLKSYLGGP